MDAIDLRWTNLVAPLVERAEREPDAEALVLIAEDGTSEAIRARALHDEVSAQARTLATLGIERGDVMILVIQHSRTLITTLLGALYRGAVPAILAYPSPRLDPVFYARRVRAVAENAAAMVVVTHPDLRAHFAAVFGDVDCRVIDLDELAAAAEGAPAAPVRIPAADDIALLQYTSGTTGLHKGVAHTHRAMLEFIIAKSRKLCVNRDDVTVSWLPLYHDLGLVSGFLMPLVMGWRTVLISPFHFARDPKVLMRTITDFRGTLCWMPNSALGHCTRALRDRDLQGVDLRHWRILSNGGEPVRLTTIRAFIDRFEPYGFPAKALQVGYGMAENIEAATHTTTPDRRPPTIDWVSRPRMQADGMAIAMIAEEPGAIPLVSCGSPLPGVQVRIVDADGQPLPERRIGEVAISSSFMLSGGYYRRPDLTATALDNGWFHTGDLGYLAAGELYVCGRRGDLIIVGGRNVHAEDIEAIAEAVAGIAPGRVVAFGVPDEGAGTDRVVMLCELGPGSAATSEDEVQRQLRRRAARELDVSIGDVRFVPRGWVIKTTSGKLARSANREKYLAELGATPAKE